MQRLILERFAETKKSTAGILFWEKVQPPLETLYLNECFTLEDGFHAEKIKGITRIPPGDYPLELKPIGASKFDGPFQRRFKQAYKGMVRLQNVPGYSEVLIHVGNSSADTEGCLLVGRAITTLGGEYSLIDSWIAMDPLYRRLVESIKAGPTVISIRDCFHSKK